MATATKEPQKNELATISLKGFPALNPAGDYAAAIKANVELAGESITALSLTRVKTPSGGGTMWTIPGAAGDENVAEIRGVLVNVQKHGVLWPDFDPKPGTLPVLRTFDLRTAEQVGPMPDAMIDALAKCKTGERTYDWVNLPFNQWGSGKNGVGKRCREQRQLFILREADAFPLLVVAQPGSIRRVIGWINELTKAGLPFYRAVVSLTLEKVRSKAGMDYSQITPKLVGRLSVEDGTTILHRFTEPLRNIAREIDVVADEEGGLTED